MTKSPLPEKVLAEVKNLIEHYVGTCGLTHTQAAIVINKKKDLKALFKYELNKSKVIGMCHRGKVTRAQTYTAEGLELLAYAQLQPKNAYKPRGRKSHPNGDSNKLRNAKLRAAKSQPLDHHAPAREQDEVRPTENRYGQSAGFISARVRRQRGLTDREVGAHMPPPSSELSSDDIRYLERHLYRD